MQVKSTDHSNQNSLIFSASATATGKMEEASAKIVKLVPPIISSETIQENIVCVRPTREGEFDISLQKQDLHTIVNCCGQGGSGYTTLFGSVQKAMKLFTDTKPSKALPVRVIGSGCMGLAMAIELKRAGYQVEISTKEQIDLPSWKAAGYFALVSVRTSPEKQEDLNKIGMDTFLTYRQIDEGNHPYITKDAVRYMPVYCSHDTESGVEDLEMKGLIPKREPVTLDFGNGVQHKNFVKFMTYFMNTTTIMRQLIATAQRMGIRTTLETIHSFQEVKEKAVFNCTGLGTRELNNDANIVPVCGHLQTFNEKAGRGHMEYMIYTKVKQDGQDEYVYLFPKDVSVTPQNPQGIPCLGFSGGTFLPNIDKLSDEEQRKLHEREFKKMEQRNRNFFYGINIS